jgi:hypothetical protein
LSQSPYAYCNGDPVNYSDPSGHLPTPPATFETTGSTGIIEVEGGSGGDGSGGGGAGNDSSGGTTTSSSSSNGSINLGGDLPPSVTGTDIPVPGQVVIGTDTSGNGSASIILGPGGISVEGQYHSPIGSGSGNVFGSLGPGNSYGGGGDYSPNGNLGISVFDSNNTGPGVGIVYHN